VPDPQETVQGATQLWHLPPEPYKGTKNEIYRAWRPRRTGKRGGKPPEIAGPGRPCPMGPVFNPVFQGDFQDGKSASDKRHPCPVRPLHHRMANGADTLPGMQDGRRRYVPSVGQR
jgi:hypothetical protein